MYAHKQYIQFAIQTDIVFGCVADSIGCFEELFKPADEHFAKLYFMHSFDFYPQNSLS